ncbi:uncharacterized protein EV420DRAFT_1075848 [Desarmillaria tabescens]|uniref:Uncharacterized protein n=1 Tax=Armillaria tabescens TaxID=1929756 RepID=A0AA39JGQ3_ARMTA|nr:uncharacterized protein EV420DRAFT_1075848 [Desarmillaria tabescens]KAK0442480.1 hypothetical protein EV420DRAFT_1075848 [Desarmillaria tabescens]
MFAILITEFLTPLIVTLVWAESKARMLGLVPEKPVETLHLTGLTSRFDVIRLALRGACLRLMLLSLMRADNSKGKWQNLSVIAVVDIGYVLILVIGPWEFKFAKFPVVLYGDTPRTEAPLVQV